MATVFPVSIQERNEWLILETLHKGQCFGELTALNEDIPSPYTVEVCSETATLLKIHINQFQWYFGGEEGEPSMSMRSKAVMKTNWLRMKKQFLAYMSKDKLLQLEYRDHMAYSRLKTPTCKQIKEVPYMQNNPESKNGTTASAVACGNAFEDINRRER